METLKEYVLRRYQERGDVYKDPIIDDDFFIFAQEYLEKLLSEYINRKNPFERQYSPVDGHFDI